MNASDLKSDLLFYAVVGVAGYALYNKLSKGSVFPRLSVEPDAHIMPIDLTTPQAPWGARELQPFIDSWYGLFRPDTAPAQPTQPTPIVYNPRVDVPIMTAPDPNKLQEIAENVTEYIGRHPALGISDYFSYYPSVAWAQAYMYRTPNTNTAEVRDELGHYITNWDLFTKTQFLRSPGASNYGVY